MLLFSLKSIQHRCEGMGPFSVFFLDTGSPLGPIASVNTKLKHMEITETNNQALKVHLVKYPKLESFVDKDNTIWQKTTSD